MTKEAPDPPPEIRIVPEVQITDNEGSTVPNNYVTEISHDTDLDRSISHVTASEDEDETLFKPFTPFSYKKLLEQAAEDKRKAEEKKNTIQEGRLVDGELKFGDDDDEEKIERDPSLVEGGALPHVLADDFPKELIGKPIEEIDPGVRDKTFVVITNRFKKKYIYRFSATRSLFMFTPWNPWRRFNITIATNQFFDYFIILTILLNMSFMAFHQDYAWLTTSEYVFTGIYSIEMIIKICARGFFVYKYTYLRDPWNWIDFIVIIAAYATIIVEQQGGSDQISSLGALKTLRVFRAFKTVSILPGLKTIISALLRSMKMLIEVVILKLFCMMVFALFALQVYVGVLRQKCVKNIEEGVIMSDAMYMEYVKNDTYWYADGGKYIICGNATGAGSCPTNYTCLPSIGENPNWGYTTFDNFGWALLNSFQLITLDYWENLYDHTIRASGPWNIIFFMMVVFFGSFYLVNMMLAVVNMAYEEEVSNAKKLQNMEKERDKLDEKLKSKKKRDKKAQNNNDREKTNKDDKSKSDTNHLQVSATMNGSNSASSASLKSAGNGVLHNSYSSLADATKGNQALAGDATVIPINNQGTASDTNKTKKKKVPTATLR